MKRHRLLLGVGPRVLNRDPGGTVQEKRHQQELAKAAKLILQKWILLIVVRVQ